MSENRTGRALKGLQVKGWIGRRRNGPGKTASIVLLWKDELSPSLKSHFLDSIKTGNQEAPLIPPKRGSDSTEIGNLDSIKTMSPYKEEKGHREKGQRKGSSSSECSTDSVQDPVNATVVEAIDDEPLPMKPPAAEAEAAAWWTPEEFQYFRQTLGDHRHQPYKAKPAELPDEEYTAKILGRFTDAEDCRLWWASRGNNLPKPREAGYGLYDHDAREKWPAFRSQYRQDSDADPLEFAMKHTKLKGLAKTIAFIEAGGLHIQKPAPEPKPVRYWCSACDREYQTNVCQGPGKCPKQRPAEAGDIPVEAPVPKPAPVKAIPIQPVEPRQPVEVPKPKHRRSRAAIQADIDKWRSSMASLAESLRPIALDAVGVLEAELAALDSDPNPDGEQAQPAAPPQGRHQHRKPQSVQARSREAITASRLGAVMGGYGL